MASGPALGKTVGGEPFAIDPRDLTTHGVIVGMTGSGKTVEVWLESSDVRLVELALVWVPTD